MKLLNATANEKLFGVKTTFHEDFYTTHLDKDSQFYREHQHEAQRIAIEITQKSSSNIHAAEERGGHVVQHMGVEAAQGYG